jgi:glyoxylase-like metal-dependent hydrolase (beta-lactamase superfamily II)
VDTLVTFDQVGALADWIERFGKRLAGIYITHGHSDHWMGLSRLRERFGDVPAWAGPQVHDRAVFEATNPGLSAYWQASSLERFRRSRQPRTVSMRPRSVSKAHRSTRHRPG